MIGTISWYDPTGDKIWGHGYVKSEDGNTYYFHSRDIQVHNPTKGMRVEFTLYKNLYSTQVDSMRELT